MNPDTLLSLSVSIRTLRAEVVFFERFAQLIASDVPLLRAIEIAEEELSDLEFRKVIQAIKLCLEQGESISDAFRRYPNYFSKFAIAIIDTGEREGRLDDNLGKLAESLRREIDSRKAIEPALTAAHETKVTPSSTQLDEQTITRIATSFAKYFVTAIERRLIETQMNKLTSDKLKEVLCIKCRKIIEPRLPQSARKTTRKKCKK